MRPRNLSGEGTVSDAGMWSTSSVVMRGSCRYSFISLVYSSSSFCGAEATGAVADFVFLLCAKTSDAAIAAQTSTVPRRMLRDLMNQTPFVGDLKLIAR